MIKINFNEGAKLHESETVTENIFRNFYGSKQFIEKSAIPKKYGFVSKNNKDNQGYPDFFKHIKSKGFDFFVVVEAKASKHKQAIDDIKSYITNNKIDGSIIGIAVSGQSKEKLKVSYYLKDENGIKELEPKILLGLDELQRLYKKEKFGDTLSDGDLYGILTKINTILHKGNKVRDTERSLFFSGIMIALTNENFAKTYKSIQKPTKNDLDSQKRPKTESHYLNDLILRSIETQLESKINNSLSKKIDWRDSFSFIKTIDFSLDEYKNLIKLIENEIFIPFKNNEKEDILGKAYKIFLHRAGKVDNKNIILTPEHIKSFMIELARLDINDVVLDTCTGSGGFLMEAMETMTKLAKQNPAKIKNIKQKQLIGFENDRVLFSLACSNMFLHGDGKSNLFFRSSLLNDSTQHLIQDDEKKLLKKIKSLKPTKCIINPPYENDNPIKFTIQALEYLEPNGKLIIIMPRTTLKSNIEKTKQILENARLDFIINMPDKIFKEQKRTVFTAIFGFTKTRHQPQDRTIFYNLQDDGLVSIQHKGRVDKFNKWQGIRQEMLDIIMSSREKYQKRILDDDRNLDLIGIRDTQKDGVALEEIFNFETGSLASESNQEGDYTFITASEEFKTHTKFTHNCEALIYAVGASGSLGRCHYFNSKFIASNLCLILTPKDKNKVEMKFYAKYLNTMRKQIVEDLADGTSKLTINDDELKKYKIKDIPKDKQKQIIEKIVKREELIKQKEMELKK